MMLNVFRIEIVNGSGHIERFVNCDVTIENKKIGKKRKLDVWREKIVKLYEKKGKKVKVDFYYEILKED